MKTLKTTAFIILIFTALFTSSNSKAILGGTIPFAKACYHNGNLIGALYGIEVNWKCEDRFIQVIKDEHNNNTSYDFLGYYIENLPVGEHKHKLNHSAEHEHKLDHSAEECIINSIPLM